MGPSADCSAPICIVVPACSLNSSSQGAPPHPLQDMDVPWQDAAPAEGSAAPQGHAQQSAAGQAGGLPSPEQLIAVYSELQQQGFPSQQVEAALSALPLPAVSLEAALDWLLLHLEASELPKRYAAQGRAAGGNVDVKHKAREAPAEVQEDAAAAAAAAALAQQERQQRQAAEAQRAAQAQRAEEEQRAAEEVKRRAWILQYMQDDDEDEGSHAGSSDVEQEVGSQPVMCCRGDGVSGSSVGGLQHPYMFTCLPACLHACLLLLLLHLCSAGAV